VVASMSEVARRAGASILCLTAIALLMVWSTATAMADSPTPAPTPSPTVTSPTSLPPTARPAPSPRPVPTAAPTAKAEPRITSKPMSETTHHKHHIVHHVKVRKAKVHKSSKKVHGHRKARAHKHQSSPKPTATAPLTLQASNSVAPVACNGPAKPNAVRPFLTAPYRGWTSIVSFFDHDLPDYVQDGRIITATGAEATPDALHQGRDFPAYWNPGLRQYIYYDGHNGFDYDISYQPVYAAAAGKVVFAGLEYPDAITHGYGNMVLINHQNGYITLYGHFSKVLVKAGQRVRRGQRIGISGNTGHSSGPHLHFTVFHNCSPTDPYGWSGPGEDPLSSYQGEISTYLWERPPLVMNPPPNWPGATSLPADAPMRIVLLRLPATSQGARVFTQSLHRELAQVEKGLRRFGAEVKADPLAGSIVVTGDSAARQIYSVPGVSSITTPDTIEGAREDVSAALAKAGLESKHARFRLSRSRHWTGYLMDWSGRTFLLGRGVKGADVAVKVTVGGARIVKTAHADPGSGAYAIDLGGLSVAQRAALSRELQGVRHRVTFTMRHHSARYLQAATHRHASTGEMSSYALGLLAVLLLFGLVVWATVKLKLNPWR
jgi:murein DD-endopeptidase MepM/ murein hydrolase activator NlpD